MGKYTHTLLFCSPLQRCCWTRAGHGARHLRARLCASWRRWTPPSRSWYAVVTACWNSVLPARPAGTQARSVRKTRPSLPFCLARTGTTWSLLGPHSHSLASAAVFPYFTFLCEPHANRFWYCDSVQFEYGSECIDNNQTCALCFRSFTLKSKYIFRQHVEK